MKVYVEFESLEEAVARLGANAPIAPAYQAPAPVPMAAPVPQQYQAPVPQQYQAPAPQPYQAPAQPATVTLAEISAAATAKAKATGSPGVVAQILQKFGARKLADIPQAAYAQVLAELQA